MPDPDPTAEDQALKDLAALPPEDRAAVEQKAAQPAPAPANGEQMVTVKVAWPVDKLVTEIEGVGTITRTPSQIPQSKLAELLEAARSARTTVTQIEEN